MSAKHCDRVRLSVGPLLVVLALISVSGCDSTDQPDWPSTYLLAGTITSAGTGEPIPGAVFALRWSAGAFGDGGDSTETDENGRYYFDRDFLSPSDCHAFAMVVTAAGYEMLVRDPGSVKCTSELQTFDFQLTPSP